jgi:hypothetical protein
VASAARRGQRGGRQVGEDPPERRELGINPVRTPLLAKAVMWVVTTDFPLRLEFLPLALGFFI